MTTGVASPAGAPPQQTFAQNSGAPQWQTATPGVSAGPTLLPGVQIRHTATNKAPMLLVEAYEKTGKCLRGNTKLVDPKTGRITTISAVVTQVRGDARVFTKNDASLLVGTSPVNFFENPAEQLYRLTTQSGYQIEATASHKFMTPDGWRSMSELGAESRVMTVAEYPKEVFWGGSGDDDKNWIRVLAYLIADGKIAETSLVFTKKEAAVREDFIAAVRAIGDDVSIYINTHGIPHVSVRATKGNGRTPRCMTHIRDVCLDGKRSADKFIPAFIFGLHKERVALFLNRLFTCDGSVEAARKISYSSTSLEMMQQIRHLLARFGIVCVMRDRFLDGALYGAELTISSRANVIRFVDEIGMFGEKGEKALRLRQELAAEPCVADETQLWRHGPYLFDRVKSVEATVVEATYDIEIADTHNFVANDFVVHNSATTTTTLKDFPRQGMHPLVLAWDKSGPDSCIRMGYQPHCIDVMEFPSHGTRPSEKGRAVVQMLAQNKTKLHEQYGAVVIDCISTMTSKFLEEARRFSDNPDGRSHYNEMMGWGVEFINRVIELQLPNVWLAWLSEPEITEDRDAKGNKRKRVTQQGGVELPGKKFRKFVAGRADHILILERQQSMVGAPGASSDGFIRQFHTQPWDNINAGGRYSHLLTEPAPAHMGYVLYAITTGTPLSQLLAK